MTVRIGIFIRCIGRRILVTGFRQRGLSETSVLRLLSLSDTTCRSVAVEWINGEMVVTDTLTGDEIQEY